MLVDKNEEIPFQKSPWNALCKNGILLKIPLFSKPNLKTNFSIKHHSSIISVQSIAFLILQTSLGYTSNKFGRFYRVPEKNRHFQENEKLQNFSCELKQRLFYQKLFLIQNFDFHSKNGKRNWVSALLSSEMHDLSIGQGLTLSPIKIIRCSFKYFKQCSLDPVQYQQKS